MAVVEFDPWETAATASRQAATAAAASSAASTPLTGLPPPPPKFSPTDEELAREVVALKLDDLASPTNKAANKAAKRERQKLAKAAAKAEKPESTFDPDAMVVDEDMKGDLLKPASGKEVHELVSMPNSLTLVDTVSTTAGSTAASSTGYDPDDVGRMDDLVNEGMAKSKYACHSCGVSERASDLLPLGLEQWAGSLDVVCWPCSKVESQADFKIQAKRGWKKYAYSVMGKAKRVRMIKWDALDELYARLLPGVANDVRLELSDTQCLFFMCILSNCLHNTVRFVSRNMMERPRPALHCHPPALAGSAHRCVVLAK